MEEQAQQSTLLPAVAHCIPRTWREPARAWLPGRGQRFQGLCYAEGCDARTQPGPLSAPAWDQGHCPARPRTRLWQPLLGAMP